MTSMKRIISQVNFFTPLSKAVSICWPARLLAILPKYVCAPVATMTAVAAPLSTLVPRKQMLVCSMDGDVRARIAGVGFFDRHRLAGERGLDDEQILGRKKRTSPGIMSPADSFTTSPGTSSCSGISFGWPSRITVAVTLIIALSLAAALSALVSCTKRSETPSTTMTSITEPPRCRWNFRRGKGQDGQDVSKITSGLRTAIQSRCSHSCLRSPRHFVRTRVAPIVPPPHSSRQARWRRAKRLQDHGSFSRSRPRAHSPAAHLTCWIRHRLPFTSIR